jgi:ABC-type polysaccharide/polyol phosphate export permease
MSTPTDAVVSLRVSVNRRSPLELIRAGMSELVSKRELTRYLVGAEIKRTHSDTVFGQLWWILDPLLQMGVYYILVSIIFRRDTPDFPLFLFVAILPWKWFSTTLNEATLSVTGHNSLIRQIRFPKIILPSAAVAAGTVSFGFGMIALALVYAFYLERLSPWILAFPLIVAVQFVFTLALGILFAALNAFFRDIQNVLRHVLRLWFYLSPGLYSLDSLVKDHPTAAFLLSLNPFAVLFRSYRNVTWGTTAPEWTGLGLVLLFSLGLLAFSIFVFKRVEPAFARILA